MAEGKSRVFVVLVNQRNRLITVDVPNDFKGTHAFQTHDLVVYLATQSNELKNLPIHEYDYSAERKGHVRLDKGDHLTTMYLDGMTIYSKITPA